MSQTCSIFLSSFLRLKPDPADPPLQLSPPVMSGLRSERWERQDDVLSERYTKDKQGEAGGTKMHIPRFCERQFNIHTAVILPHVHGKEDWSLFFTIPI